MDSEVEVAAATVVIAIIPKKENEEKEINDPIGLSPGCQKEHH